MSRENVEIARRVYGHTNPLLDQAAAVKDISDAPEWWEIWDPNVVIVEIAEFPVGMTALRGTRVE